MLHAGEAHSPPARILPIHCSQKAVWSLYVPGPPSFKIAGSTPGEGHQMPLAVDFPQVQLVYLLMQNSHGPRTLSLMWQWYLYS